MSALDVLHSLVMEDGSRWGDVATGEQRADAAAILDLAGPPFHFLTRSRGYSKTTDVAGVVVAVLAAQAPAGTRSYAVAADQAQARLLLDSIEGFVRRTPGLLGFFDLAANRVTARSGASVETLPADASSSWGLRPYLVVADEITEWGETPGPRRVWESVSSAVPKARGRLVAIATAGAPSHWSRKVRDHAEGDPLWRLSELDGPPPWMPKAYLAEQRRRLTESQYARLFLNRWTAPNDALVDPDDLAACVVLDGPLPPEAGREYVIGLDVGVKNDATVAALCHAEPVVDVIDSLGSEAIVGTRVVLDRMETWQGSRAAPVSLQEVEEWIAHAAARYSPCEVVFDPWQMIGSAQRLDARGLTVHEYAFTGASVGRLASTLYALLRERALRLPDDDDLLDELRNVRLVERTPGMLRLDHEDGKHDDRAIAIALAAQRLLDRPVANTNLSGSYDYEVADYDAEIASMGDRQVGFF